MYILDATGSDNNERSQFPACKEKVYMVKGEASVVAHMIDGRVKKESRKNLAKRGGKNWEVRGPIDRPTEVSGDLSGHHHRPPPSPTATRPHARQPWPSPPTYRHAASSMRNIARGAFSSENLAHTPSYMPRSRTLLARTPPPPTANAQCQEPLAQRTIATI